MHFDSDTALTVLKSSLVEGSADALISVSLKSLMGAAPAMYPISISVSWCRLVFSLSPAPAVTTVLSPSLPGSIVIGKSTYSLSKQLIGSKLPAAASQQATTEKSKTIPTAPAKTDHGIEYEVRSIDSLIDPVLKMSDATNERGAYEGLNDAYLPNEVPEPYNWQSRFKSARDRKTSSEMRNYVETEQPYIEDFSEQYEQLTDLRLIHEFLLSKDVYKRGDRLYIHH